MNMLIHGPGLVGAGGRAVLRCRGRGPSGGLACAKSRGSPVGAGNDQLVLHEMVWNVSEAVLVHPGQQPTQAGFMAPRESPGGGRAPPALAGAAATHLGTDPAPTGASRQPGVPDEGPSAEWTLRKESSRSSGTLHLQFLWGRPRGLASWYGCRSFLVPRRLSGIFHSQLCCGVPPSASLVPRAVWVLGS